MLQMKRKTISNSNLFFTKRNFSISLVIAALARRTLTTQQVLD